MHFGSPRRIDVLAVVTRHNSGTGRDRDPTYVGNYYTAFARTRLGPGHLNLGS